MPIYIGIFKLSTIHMNAGTLISTKEHKHSIFADVCKHPRLEIKALVLRLSSLAMFPSFQTWQLRLLWGSSLLLRSNGPEWIQIIPKIETEQTSSLTYTLTQHKELTYYPGDIQSRFRALIFLVITPDRKLLMMNLCQFWISARVLLMKSDSRK